MKPKKYYTSSGCAAGKKKNEQKSQDYMAVTGRARGAKTDVKIKIIQVPAVQVHISIKLWLTKNQYFSGLGDHGSNCILGFDP